MEIKSLDRTNREIIFEAFWEAFKNYVIPLDFNREVHLRRWETSGVDFSLSFGAFDQEKLIAFILHVPVGDEVFNFGTGVIPSHRGQGLIEKIYQKASPTLQKFSKVKLEVIKENHRALSLYKKMGFEIKRELLSFQGELNICCGTSGEYQYNVAPLKYSMEMENMRAFLPATESCKEVLIKASENHELHELRRGSTLVAYAIYTPFNASIKELGAIPPIERHFDQLLLYMKLGGQKIRIMNVEESARPVIQYLTSKGMNNFVTQFEMEMPLAQT